MNTDNNSLKNLLVAGGALAACYVLYKHSMDSKQENFQFSETPKSAKSFQGVPPRPGYKAPLAPRFDTNRTTSNSLLGVNRTPPVPLQGAPASPVLNNAMFQNPDFVQLGGAGASAASAGNLSTQQVNDMIRDRVGSGRPEYQDTADLLPVPDMKYTVGIDPTDPQNFMYDRTIFGTLKRRYGNGVDFIRGDLDIKPEQRGWFDLQPPTEKDVVTGYFDRYIDIQQEMAIKDATFQRATPVASLLKEDINPWGTQTKFAYNRV